MEVKRIFWFGMHKVLRTTELRQLRALGYEVFSPAYLSPIYDQSADRTIDVDQPTTLPKEIFDELLGYNFFYNAVSPRIAEILNTYFDAAIVTISADWLNAFLGAYRGPVVYRIYGQHFVLSNRILELGLWEKLIARDSFSIVPFAAETLDREHDWFTALCHEIVPYQIPDDVFAFSGSWARSERRRRIATHIPNIENPYYQAAYETFRSQYPQHVFEISGPQRSHPRDPSITGALPREDFLRRLASASGFLYNYSDEVCYLTPIEMMELGGPVLYAPDSLLARFYDGKTPGLIAHPTLATRKLRALLDGDPAFIADVLAAQETVRKRYDRAVVQPLFARAFRRLLGEPERKPAFEVHDRIVRGAAAPAPGKPAAALAVLLHDAALFSRDGARVAAGDGTGRFMVNFVRALVERSDHRLIISCLERTRELLLDLFAGPIAQGRVELHALEGTGAGGTPLSERVGRLDFIAELNRRTDIGTMIVPHPSRFPEALLFSGPRVTYMEAYQPPEERIHAFAHLREEDLEREAVAVAALRGSRAVLASSAYTSRCIAANPAFGGDIAGKLTVPERPYPAADAPLPGTRRGREFSARMGGRPFIFYPTANEPVRHIAFLLEVFAALRVFHADLMIVLTDHLGQIPGVGEVADARHLKPHIEIVEGAGAGDLRWLYEHAAALCLTSSFEGDVPQQIIDALRYGTPVVASRLPAIVERLGPDADRLLLCRPLDVASFTQGLTEALSDRPAATARQAKVLTRLALCAGDMAAAVALVD
ncbi:glycosyltransferase [Azorhizobium doebereinerae]|uniref:glycosyltransferase n=1 Tax=Azorhizobium doebereinerae TaxID=281091 RepID=UPI0004245693|nr:glycosyltransferase [Azorhizobium doebereinerae]